MDRRYETIKWEREGAVGTIRLNQPESLNALSMRMRSDILDVISRIQEDKELRVVVFTAEGKAFSAGGNMEEFLAHAKMIRQSEGAIDLFTNEMSRAFLSVEIPIIAAINGPAVGGGLTLSLTCDIRIASESARFGAVFVRAGLAPEYGSSFLLARAVGLTRSSELILTGRIIDAAEALSMGLVSEVIPDDQLQKRAAELAGQIASHSPLAVKMAKRVLRHGLECTLSQALDYEELAETYCFSSADHQEAVLSFIEKRAPKFRGK